MNEPNNAEPKKEKKVEKVISGEVSSKKRSMGSRIGRAMINDDIGDMADYLIFQVAIPVLKQACAEGLTNAVNGIFGTNVRVPLSGNTRNVAYSKISTGTSQQRQPSVSERDSSIFDYEEQLFETRADCEEVINALANIIEEYHSATVMDFYDLIGKTAPYTAQKYGWKSMSSAYPQKVRDGYIIKFPRATLI